MTAMEWFARVQHYSQSPQSSDPHHDWPVFLRVLVLVAESEDRVCTVDAMLPSQTMWSGRVFVCGFIPNSRARD
jgi:hypothetical protein